MRHPIILAVFGILAALTVAIALVLTFDDSTRLLVSQPLGVIDSGEAFDVTIGEPRETALTTVQGRFRHVETTRGGRCLSGEFSEDYLLDVLDDKSWRRATICIASRDGRVVGVLWFHNPVFS